MSATVAKATYKLEKEGVFSQSSNASCKSQNEHNSSYHEEEPNWIKASQVGDGGDVGQHSLGKKQCQGITDVFKLSVVQIRLAFLLFKKGEAYSK